MRSALAVLCLGAVPNAAVSQTVAMSAGDVVYRGAGAERRVTTLGRDTMPVLSPDGRFVAFVRRTPGDSISTAWGWEERTELWIVGADGTGARRLLRGRADERPGRTLASLARPAFAPDGRTVYVESSGWVTSGALWAVDVATGAERFVCPSTGFEVLTRGRYWGHLLVWQHRYGRSGAVDGTWIVSPSGRTVALVALGDAPDAEARIAAARAGRVP